MKVENMSYNAKTAFTERREIIDKLNECINSINTYGSEKIADIEKKNVQQDSDIASLKSASYSQMVTITAHETKISNIETKNAKQDGDINNLKNADTNNVKIDKINEYAVGLTGKQDISGVKNFVSGISAYPSDWHNVYVEGGNVGDIKLFAKLKKQKGGRYLLFELIESSNTSMCYGILGVHNINPPTSNIAWFLRKGFGPNNPLQSDSIVIANDGTNIYLGSRKKNYGTLMIRVKVAHDYKDIETNPTEQIEWLSAPINIGDGSDGYTLTEAVE